MARIVCQVLHRPNRVTFIWSAGAASFEPYHLHDQEVESLYRAARSARGHLARAVEGHDPQAAAELAEAGHQIYQCIFRHNANDRHPREIQNWLNALRDRNEVASLDMLGDMPGHIPWNAVYDQTPATEALRAGDPVSLRPFWGFQYVVAVGKRVNPLRVASVLDNPTILLVADPELLDRLPPSQKNNLSDWARSRELTVLNSLTALRNELRHEAPDILYVFAGLERDALRLGRESLTIQEVRDLLASAKQGNPDPIVFLQVSAPASTWETWECFVSATVNTLAGVVMCEVPASAALANQLGVEALGHFLQNEGLGAALKAARAGTELAALAYSAFCPTHVKVAGDNSSDPDIPGPEPLPLPDYPFHPLVPFESEDRGLFTGREDDTVRCASILDEAATHGLLLHGAGGIGKSSFLRAGLVPHLETEAVGYMALRDRTPDDSSGSALGAEHGERAYPVVALRPGRDLMGQLAEALCAFCAQAFAYTTPDGNVINVDLPGLLAAFVTAPDTAVTAAPPAHATQAPSSAVSSTPLRGPTASASAERASAEMPAAELWRVLERHPHLLAGLLDELTRRLPFELVLVVEQGEDLVLQVGKSAEGRHQRGLESLAGVLRSPARCKIVLALRTEHFGRLMDHMPSGPERWRNFFLDELSEEQMLRAIQFPTAAEPVPYGSEIPSQKYRFTFEEGLTAQVVKDVVLAARDQQSSPLPLLQVVCADLYDRMFKRKEDVITRADRKDQGSVGEVLTRYVAKKINGLPISPADRIALRKLMENLYVRHSDGSITRKLVPTRTVAKAWKSLTPLEAVVDAAAHEGLVEVNQMLVGGRPDLFISLPQESLAQSALQWEEEHKRKAFGRSRVIDTLWIMIPMLFLAAAITYTVTRRAAATANSETPADQEQVVKVLQAQLEFNRWPMYVGDLVRAEQAWNNDNPLLARQFLLQQQPYKQTDLRDFEWYYLWNKIQGKGPDAAGHKGLITSVAISPDGSTGASASLDGTIKLWNLVKVQENATLHGHAGPVLAVAFSPDGKMLASGGADKIIRLWDASAGTDKPAVVAKATRELTGHAGDVRALVFGPDTLISAGADKQVITWDLGAGTPARVFKEHTGAVQALALAPDGKTMASAGPDSDVLVHDGLKTLQTIHAAGPVSALAFALDGKTLATGGTEKRGNLEHGMIRFWNTAAGKETGASLQHASGVFGLAYVPKSGLLASAGKDNLLRVWDLPKERQVSAFKGHLGWVASFAVSATGSTIVSGSHDGTIKIWGSLPPETIAAHEGAAEAVVFTADDKAVISGGRDGTVRFWNPATGEALAKLTGLGEVTSLAYTAKESPAKLAAGTWNEKNEGDVRLWEVAWDAKEGVKTKELPPLKGHTKGVTCLAFSPDGKTLASGSADQTAILWDVVAGKKKAILKGHEGEVRCLAFPTEEGILMTGGADGKVRQWSVEDGKEFRPPLEVHTGAVNAVRYFFGVVGFITAGDDHSTKFWVWNPGKQPEPDHQHRSHGQAVTSMAASANGRFVVTGSVDQTVKVLDTQIEESKPSAFFGQERFTFTGRTPIRAVAVSSNNLILAAAGEDGTIHFWRAAASKARKTE